MAAPVAIRELVNDPETGALKVVLRDAQTGVQLELAEAASYNIAALNSMGGLVPVNESIIPQNNSDNAQIYQSINPEQIPQKPILDDIRQGGNGGSFTGVDTSGPRTQSGNFGYINKPGILGLTNLAPGPLGLASRLTSGIINNNNSLAVSKARQSIGLDPLGAASIAKQTLKDNLGQVADVSINNETYSVGLEASTPKGRTNLTPNEARNRALTSGVSIKEATKEESKANIQANPVKNNSILGGVLDKGKNLLGIESPSPLKNTTQPAKVNNNSIGINSSVSRTTPQSTTHRNRAMPSFAEVSKMSPQTARSPIPSMSNVDLEDREQRVPGLAGITKTPSVSINSRANLDGLDSSVVSALGAVSEVVGDVKINSGYRNPTDNAKVNGVKKSQHMNGRAVDIDTTGWSDSQKQAAAEAAGQLGVKGFGIGQTDRMMHIDTREQPASWGYANGRAIHKDIKDQPAWAQKTLTDIRDAGPYQVGPLEGPQPKSRPTPNAVDIGLSPKTTPTKTPTTGLASLSNRDMSNAGINLDSKQQKALATTVAGELSQSTLRGLARQDPKAIAEASQVTQVAANRIASVGFDKAITPSQFNSIGKKAVAVTRDNMKNYGSVVSDVVGKTLSGEMTANNPQNTHYANRDVGFAKNKGYYSDMSEVNKQGPHTFGTISGEFAKNKDSLTKENTTRQAVANASEFSGVSRAEQKADRQVSDTSKAPSKGLGTKPSSKDDDNKDTKSSKSMSGGRTRSTSAGLGSRSSSNKGSGKSSKSDSRGSKSSGSKSGGKSSSKK